MTAVIWIDWYAYHVARFRALADHNLLRGSVRGIELIGGCGVHGQLRFREESRGSLPISTVLPGRDWEGVGGLTIAVKLWRELSRLKPASLLVPGYYTLPGISAALWGKLHGRRTVLMTESARQDYSRTWWKESLKKIIIRTLFDKAIAGGAPHIRYLRELGFPADQIGDGYDVVDNREIAARIKSISKSSAASDHGLPDNYILFVGRLAEEKNLVRLLGSFSEYRLRGGSWSLVLAGDGPLRDQLAAEIERQQLGSFVRLEGLKSSRGLLPYYAFAECLVLPSTREPWGLVVNEGMAAGLPIVASKQCGCAEDLVDRTNGFTFDALDSLALTEAFLKMERRTSFDRKQMGECSKRIIAAYSLERWASEVARLVNS